MACLSRCQETIATHGALGRSGDACRREAFYRLSGRPTARSPAAALWAATQHATPPPVSWDPAADYGQEADNHIALLPPYAITSPLPPLAARAGGGGKPADREPEDGQEPRRDTRRS